MIGNFDIAVSRRNTHSYKWDTVKEGVQPMWVADMDFRTAPAVIYALQKRVEHGVFGYAAVSENYYRAVINWFARRHRWRIVQDSIIYTTGVVPAISAIIKALTSAGDRVLVQTPVYNCFFSSIRNNGCEVVANPLICDDGFYRMDFDDLERKAADPQVRLMLLCNPHNPVGRVWTLSELKRVGEICLRNDVWVIADEIHCELVFPEYRYTPFASISNAFSQRSVVCVSPSKAFNLAGLQIANIVVSDPPIRMRIDQAINENEVCDVSPLGVEALIAAYNHGEEWLEELKPYLYGNYNCLKAYFAEHLPLFRVTAPEGGYLVWVDCRILQLSSQEIARQLLEKAEVFVSEGSRYGASGEGFIRINIACSRKLLLEALERLKSAFLVLLP